MRKAIARECDDPDCICHVYAQHWMCITPHVRKNAKGVWVGYFGVRSYGTFDSERAAKDWQAAHTRDKA